MPNASTEIFVYRIAAWSDHFENNRTRELKSLDWVPIPNKHDGDGYTELLEHPNGAAHFGAWNAIVQVASKCDPRGTLLRDGRKPHDSQSLARITRLPALVYDEALPRLVHIGWLELISLKSLNLASVSQEGAGIPQDAAEKRLRKGREGDGTEEKGKEELSDAAASDPPPEPDGGDSVATGGRKRTGGKAVAARKPATGPNAEIVRHHEACWAAQHDGESYAHQGGKDAAAVGRILTACKGNVEKAKRIVSEFNADDDAFISKTGHTLAVLGGQLNRYLSGAHKGISGDDGCDPANDPAHPDHKAPALTDEIRKLFPSTK